MRPANQIPLLEKLKYGVVQEGEVKKARFRKMKGGCFPSCMKDRSKYKYKYYHTHTCF
jgi:hypothetical protein